ncbi:MAG: hypothetical protein J5588_00725, partial [Bacteroidales bacterium]|nr:hypothetical protein [Bacteroidales bacterium]
RMDKNLVEIQKRAADVNRYVQAYDSQSVIPAIELDIVLQKTRELYDLLSELKQVEPTEKVVESVEKTVEKPVEEQAPAEEQIIDVLSVKDEPVQEEQIPEPKVEEVSQPEPTPSLLKNKQQNGNFSHQNKLPIWEQNWAKNR